MNSLLKGNLIPSFLKGGLGWIFIIVSLLLTACTSQNYAPVHNAWSISSEPKGEYTVQRGETLYAIAWRYDMDYRALAEANHLSPPYSLYVGQVLSLKVLPPKPENKPVVIQQPKTVAKPSVPQITQIRWRWPAKGRIIATYSPSAGRKGIDIAGKMGEPIYAAAAGKVAYCGNGLRGYGNLIIIKHNDEYLSAYAHNKKLLVHDGQEVKAGQMIATMGNTESKTVLLHFEIRKAGKSVNPLIYVKP